MRSTHRIILGVVAAAAVAALAAGAALATPSIPIPPPVSGGVQAKGGPQPRVAPLPASADAATLRKQQTLLPTAQALDAQARGASSDIAGVSVDVAGGVVNVYRKNVNAPLPAGTPVNVVVHQARFSRDEMLAASQRILADAKPLADSQVAVEAVGPSLDGSGLEVTVFAADGAALDRETSALRARYGGIVATVHAAAQKTSDANLYFGGFRFNDYAPWYGGDRIMSSSAGCSDAFAAYYNGPAMLTAAHCGPVGATWYNGPHTDGTWSTVGAMNYSNASTDVASIAVSSTTNTINVGSDPQSPSQLSINGWASPVVGQYLCQSGSYTGERCGLLVVDTGQYTASLGPLADVVSIYGSASPAAGHGDSGGPVYLRTGSTGVAEGLVHGQLTPNAQSSYPAYFTDTLWCPSPEGWSQRCASGFSFADLPGY